MLSGRQTLGSIETALREQNQKIKFADQKLSELADQRLQLQKTELENFRALARQRVDYIATGETLSAFDKSEHQVISLLQQRKEQATALTEEIEQLESEYDGLRQQRERQADTLEQATANLDAAEVETQNRLQQDPAYEAQRKKSKDAERVALHADEKASLSEGEQEEKGQSYQDDTLFSYLWERNYGTSEYRANPLIRWLDGRVARLIGYTDAHTNYARLREIPLRLREHATRAKQAADDEFQALKRLDEEAREADGIAALEAAVDAEQRSLDSIDQGIEENENQHRQQLERKQLFATGKDKSYQAVVDYLGSELSRDDLQQLRREALSTPFPEDDIIVSQMLDGEREKQSLEKTSQDIQQTQERHYDRLKELENMRAEFKRRRFDDPRAGYRDGALVGMVLNNVINGAMRSDSLWDVLGQQQRHKTGRARPDFGSGGFGRGTIWGGGRGGSGGGIFGGGGGLGGGSGGGRPKSRRGNGGFHTGGGF